MNWLDRLLQAKPHGAAPPCGIETSLTVPRTDGPISVTGRPPAISLALIAVLAKVP